MFSLRTLACLALLGLSLCARAEVNGQPPVLMVYEGDLMDSEAKAYMVQVRRRVDEALSAKTVFDDRGRRICIRNGIGYIVFIEPGGKIVDIGMENMRGRDPDHALGNVLGALTKAIWSISPLPPFPTPSILSYRMIGLPNVLLYCVEPHSQEQINRIAPAR
ncbi:MAG: TonB C-terminal domain-containing protein [Thiobacillus sp.]|nr:TonB C-terminal domain-containing protein [Thiobacillus sp.]